MLRPALKVTVLPTRLLARIRSEPAPVVVRARLPAPPLADGALFTVRVCVLLKLKLPPVVNAPNAPTTLAPLSVVLPTELPVRVPAVIAPPAPSVIAPAEVSVVVVPLTTPLIARLPAVVVSVVLAPPSNTPVTTSELALVRLNPAAVKLPSVLIWLASARVVAPTEPPVKVPAVMTPAPWLIAAPLKRPSIPVAVTLLFNANPSPVSDTLAPLRSPGVANTPPFEASVRSALPVSIAPTGRVSTPPAIRLTLPLSPLFNAAIVRSLMSVIDTPIPVTETLPWKSLSVFSSVIAWPPALKPDKPVTTNLPPCVMSPVVVVTDNPPLPIFSAFALQLPLWVVKLPSAPLVALLPTAPPKVTDPVPAFTVRARAVVVALSTVPVKFTALFVVVSTVSLPRVTASL